MGEGGMKSFGILWEEPQVLLLVPLVPVACWLIFRGKAGQSGALALPKILRRWAGARAVVDRPGATRRRGGYWLAAGLMLALVALARPQWDSWRRRSSISRARSSWPSTYRPACWPTM
ncbi:MAG: hypothetical protein EBS60_03270 [Verrucomicrobia bacterium]|nr:hypothetical protein [Verrucomicrobiota bacterium]